MGANPVDLPNLYDYVFLAGQQSPGLAKISGAEAIDEWEVKKASGQDGASTTHKGADVSKFTVELTLWKDLDTGYDHYAAYDKWRLLFEQTRLAKPRGLDIYHPDLARLGIKSVVVEKEGQLEHDGRGGAKVKISFLEFKPAKPKPAEAPTASKKKSEPDPDQDLLDKINAMHNKGTAATNERGGKSVFFK